MWKPECITSSEHINILHSSSPDSVAPLSQDWMKRGTRGSRGVWVEEELSGLFILPLINLYYSKLWSYTVDGALRHFRYFYSISRVSASRRLQTIWFDTMWHDRTGEDRTGHYTTGEDKAGQERTGEDRTGQDTTRYDTTGEDRTRHNRRGHDMTGEDRTRQERTGQDRLRGKRGRDNMVLFFKLYYKSHDSSITEP